MKKNFILLPAIRETPADFDECEERLKELFKREIYLPLLSLLKTSSTILNARPSSPLVLALRLGRITFSKGVFSGKFNAGISKDLLDLGARFDRRTSTFRINLKELPYDIQGLIYTSEFRFSEKIAEIDKKLAQILPEEIADKVKLTSIFDRNLWKVDQSFQESVKNISVPAQLTPERRKRIASEWQNNMELWIKDFTEKEIIQLRKSVQKSIFAGNRYGSLIQSIQDSYGVSQRKAKFLARQETSLLMAKFKEVRYTDAGIYQYTWHSVTGTKLHPVRPQHKKLADESKAGKIFRWDDPPVTTEPGQPERRNNPGCDYNCRCFARAYLRLK